MKIKICGLTRPEDIDYTNEVGPDCCGFILNYPESRRSLTIEEARDLRSRLRDDIPAVGVFVDEDPHTVADCFDAGIIQIAQLHGTENESYITALRLFTLGKMPIWQAFLVEDAQTLAQANASTANMLVLDSGRGSGESFDWSLLSAVTRPYFLAGGLDPDRIKMARKLDPYGVDVSSGVETNGVKDKNKMDAAVRAARLE